MARLCRRPITSLMSLCNLREEDALLDSDPPIVLFRRELAFTFVQVTGLLVLESLYSLNSSSASPPSVSPLFWLSCSSSSEVREMRLRLVDKIEDVERRGITSPDPLSGSSNSGDDRAAVDLAT